VTHDLAFKGATIVRPSGRARLHVYVDDGRIAAMTSDDRDAREVVDATGLHLLPGMVDTHVHLMDPGPTDREDFPTGTEAAACAGVTTIVEHTHAHPVREVTDLADKRAHLADRAHVDYGLAAHVWPDRIDRIPALYEAGVTFFKIFTCTTHGVPGIDAAHLLDAFRALASCGAPTLVHCEDETITEEAERALKAAGREDNAIIPEWRNLDAELVAVAVTGTLAARTGVRATVAHVSSPQVVKIVEQARAAGADLAAEACPQYFLLREQEVLEHGAFRKFTPPMRARTDDDEQQLWRLLRDGALTHVSTDHAPSTREQKTEGSIWDVHFGLPGIDTTLPMLLDAVGRGMLSLEDVVRTYAEAPARRYGLAPRKGSLAIGADADVVLVDLEETWTLTDAHVRSKAGWTPYAGRSVQGRVVGTWLRGRRLATGDGLQEGQFGRFVPGYGHRG
jgi:allantoinase